MKTLQEIGTEFQTDKHDVHHAHCGSSYLDVYERYLASSRDLPVKLLEIGVRDGCSHRMWREYFQNGTIFGIDIDPRCKQSQSDRIRIFIGSQSDPDTINEATQSAGGSFDVILDDGSHVNSLTLRSFELLYPLLKPGGLYIIEDLGCSYLGNKLLPNIVEGQWPGMSYNKGIDWNNNRSDMDSLFQTLIRSMDLVPHEKPVYDVEYVHFYSKIAVIKKPLRVN